MKKKLLFFLLTMVGVFLCAPPALAWNLGSSFEIQLRGEGYDGASWNGTKMTWIPADNRYEFDITASSTTIKFKFYWDNNWRSPSSAPALSTSLSDLKWSDDFNGEGNDNSFTVTQGQKYKIIVAQGSSNPKYAIYKVQTKVAKPTFSPASGTVDSGTEITISCATSGATIYYTLDGSDPKTSSTKKTYSSTSKPVITSANKKLRAYAAKSGMTDSDITDVTYNVNTPYDFSGNTKPAKLRIKITNGSISGTNYESTNDGNFLNLTYNSSEKMWESEFTSINGYINFEILPDADYFKANEGKTEVSDTWVTKNTNNKDNATFYQSGMTANVKYKFQLKGQDSEASKIQWRITETKVATPTFNPGAGAVAEGTDITINCTTDGSTIYYTTDGSEPKTSSTKYTAPVAINAACTLKAKGFKDGLEASATATAAYTIKKVWTVKADISKLVAGNNTLWTTGNIMCKFMKDDTALNGDNGAKGSASGNVVTFTLSSDTEPNKIIFHNGEWNGSKQTDFLTFVNNKTYVLNWNGYDQNVIEDVNAVPSGVNLPYGPNDFKEPKYFLVGSRMGAWHLQPEWELLKKSDNTYVMRNGRFLCEGDFAVARVSNYFDYTHHYYEVLANVGKGVNLNTTSITGIKKVRRCENAKDNPYINDLMYIKFFSTYLGDNPKKIDIMKEDKGTYVDAITLTKNSDDNYTLDLTITNASNNTNRVFALVGSDIVNKALTGDYKTYRRQKVSDGWQESWIQYDAAGKPYIDANGNYLYHTAYNSNWLSKNRVRFNIPLDGKGNFAYSSANITFMHYTLLADLDTDPYREFYKHFGKDANKTVSNNMEIKGGKAEDGTAYSFKASIDTDLTSDDWQCFVVRNVWVKGQFKIWTGWGGNSISTDSEGGGSDARWNCVNGGPKNNGCDSNNDPIPLLTNAAKADITAGTSQVMNRLHIDQGSGSNYRTDNDGSLTFYNRIVLWYNNGANGGIDKSFVMFIQEKSTPAIKAFLKGNDMNMPYYEWNLLNAATSSEQVTGYTVTRYRVTEEGNINPNPIETVTLESAVDAKSFTERTFSETAPLNPGTYFYNIKVTFKDGDNTIVREANSNRITVYGDNIAPDVRVEQLVILNKAGFDKLGVTALFNDRLNQANVTYKKDQFYLTYRGNLPTADYYLIRYAHPYDYTEEEYKDENTVPAIAKQPQIIQIKAEVAREILNDPALYVWAGRFYVRALDYSAFKHNYDQIGTKYSTPVITLTDEEAIKEGGETKEFGGENIATQLVKVKTLVGYDKEYFGTIVGRKGLLKAGRMIAEMTYSYGETLGQDGLYEYKIGPLTHSVPFTPVIAPPYGLKQMYEYRTIPVNNALADKVAAGDKAKDYKAYYKIGIIPSNNVAYNGADPKTGAIAVLAPESAIPNERHLDMVIEFTRPNISKRIYDLYDIYYKINVKAVETDKATEQAKLNYTVGSIDNEFYYDPNEDATYDGDNGSDYTTPNPYHVTIQDVHPSAAIYPYFEITEVQYRRKNLIDPDANPYKTLVAVEDKNLHTSEPNVVSTATSISELGLGVNPAQEEDNVGADGCRWFLYSHKELIQDDNIGNKDENGNDIYIKNFDATKLFLIEITDGTNYAYGETLWTHDHKSSTQNDSGHYEQYPPFFIAALKKSEASPSVTITPVYIFFHQPNFSYESKAGFRYLLPEGVEPPATPSQAARRAAGAETASPEFVFVEGNIHNETDASGKVIRTIYDATKDSQITVARGAVATVESGSAPVMTGIEDVIGEGADGEAVYYNLQGMRVAHPVRGQVYIRCQAGKNETIVF